jgi:ABC-type uncharacterized transport system involved in gliding motility auxiliary subunit
VWDSEVMGFGVRVWTSGSMVYVFNYQQRRKQHWVRLGHINVLPFAQASKKATAMRPQLVDIQNPGQAIQQKRQTPSVSELCDRFIAEHVNVKIHPSTQKEYCRVLEHDIRPALGHLKAREIAPQDVPELHHRLSAAPIQAIRTMALLSKMLSLFELWGLRPSNSNPCVFPGIHHDRVA